MLRWVGAALSRPSSAVQLQPAVPQLLAAASTLRSPVEPSAALLPIRTLDDAPCRRGAFLPHTLRFEPRASRTSALFVARIGKRSAGDGLEAE